LRKVNAEQGATDKGIRHEALLTEYNEVCSNFRTLTDIRFRLLAFLPIAAGVAVALSKEDPYSLGLALPLFGLAATIGLATYNARNDQLYDELVGRAAAIERTLDIPDGAFANRPTAWLRIRLHGRKKEILEKCIRLLNSKWEIPEWRVDHRTAVGTIYAASIALWLFGIVAYVLAWGKQIYLATGLPSLTVKEPSAWMNFIAIIIAVIVTFFVCLSIKAQKKNREEEMREYAKDAVKRAFGSSIREAQGDNDFIAVCAKLSGSTEDKVRARARFHAALDQEQLRYYGLQGTDELVACRLIALLTDLPPQWILDCYTNRRGVFPESTDADKVLQ